MVLPGVTIGDHCAIAANSVVTQSIPHHSLAAGCPARVIKTIGNRDSCV
jgi:acetyltransferase-like isoleucine patch superfamily enzyme